MLLSENFIETLVKGYKTSPFIVGRLFSYNGGLQRIEIIPGKAARNQYMFRYRLFSLLGAFALFRILQLNTHGTHENWVEKYMFFVYGLIAERYRVRGKYPEEFTSYFNAAIQLELRHTDGLELPKNQRVLQIAKLYFLGTRLFSQYVAPVLAALVSAVDPSSPLNTVWPLEKILHGGTSNGIQYFASFVFNFVANYCVWEMMTIQCFCSTLDILIGVLSLNFSHDVVHRKLSQGILKELNGCSDELSYELHLYRSFHLLVERYNDAIRTILFSVLLICGVAQVVAAAGLLMQKSSDNVPLVRNLFFLGVTIQAVLVILVVYGCCGRFYSQCYASVTNLRTKVMDTFVGKRRPRKRLERFIISCQHAKIKFGLSNFIEKQTPALFQMYCLELLVDILLVKQ